MKSPINKPNPTQEETIMENPIKAVPENETPDQATERRHQVSHLECPCGGGVNVWRCPWQRVGLLAGLCE